MGIGKKKACIQERNRIKKKVLMLASVASMIDQFNVPNIQLIQEMGYEVHVACNFLEGNTCDRKRISKLQKMLKKMAVVYHQWDCPRNIWPFWKCTRAYQQLQALMKKHTFVWMHCHSPIGGALARVAAHRQNIRVIYTAHGFHFYRGAPLWNWIVYYPIEKLLAYWTDILVVVNKEDYHLARQKLHAKKIFYIPGVGIDTKQFYKHPWSEENRSQVRAAYSRKFQIPENKVWLLSVGELSKRKNHQAVLNALAKIGRGDICYLICGQGKEKDRLWQQAKALGISEQLWMLGFQENMANIYQMADIFIFPSRQEGLPAALMEAMAAGLPCIVSDVRGNRELMKQPRTLFSLDQPQQLCKALEYMLKHPKYRNACGTDNRKQVQNYDIQVVKRRMKRIYMDM